MDSYQFYIDSTKQRISIDCSTYQSSLFSLAALLDRDADTLLQDIIETGKDLTNHDPGQGVFEELLAERVIGKGFYPVNIENVHWFHFTRALESSMYQEGLLPLRKNISKVWDILTNVFEPINKGIVSNLQSMEKNKQCGPQYIWKINREFDQGPFAMLVKDSGFYWKDIGNVNYFGAPEIVQDICSEYERTFSINILPLFMKRTFPCIVAFKDECDMEDIEGIARSIISYLFFRPQGRMVSCWCYNGRGKIIPSSSILKVEDNPLLSEISFEYQQLFTQNF